jgi:hypothetical protein
MGTDPVNLTLPLYNVSNGSLWTGSGTYDFFAVLNGDGGHYYKAGSIKITSATTNIPWSSVAEIFPVSDDPPIIPAKWQGTYGGHSDFPLSFTIHANGTVSWKGGALIPDGSKSGATIMNGGAVTYQPSTLLGDWVYLAIDGEKLGILIFFTQAIGGYQGFIGMGSEGVSGLISEMEGYGVTFIPSPNISDLSQDSSIMGDHWFFTYK